MTGAAGFIGSSVIRRLVEEGFDAHGLIRAGTDSWRLGNDHLDGLLHVADLADDAAFETEIVRIAPEIVVHTAAYGGHPLTREQRAAAWRDTAQATIHLLEALRLAPVQRLIHLGSSLEYRPVDRPLRPDDPLEPETYRGMCKAAASLAVREWSYATKTPAVILRPFSVYGPSQQPDRVIPVLLSALRTGAPFATPPGNQGRDFVHVDDVVSAVMAAVHHQDADGLALNLGSGVMTTVEDLIALAEEVTGETLEVVEGGHPGGHADRPMWCADITDTIQTLGWAPLIDLRSGIRSLWERR